MNRLKNIIYVIVAVVVMSFIVPYTAQAAEGEETGYSFAMIFLWLAVILMLSKLAGFVERFGQPAVLGELALGVILGNLGLVGIYWFEPIIDNKIVQFIAELGVVILLFQVGLESQVSELRQVGGRALMVAIVGVVLPFFLGAYIAGPILLPGLSNHTYLFIGATLTATSVGITARVFRELGALQSYEAKIVLGAAVIDDVLGLIVLAVVSDIVQAGSVSILEVGIISLKAILFLGGTTVLGHYFAPALGDWLSKIQPGTGIKFIMAFSYALTLAYLAEIIGLAPIIGAFTAGLVFEPVHFKQFKDPAIVNAIRKIIINAGPKMTDKLTNLLEEHSRRQLEDLLEPVGYIFIPIFFVVTGMTVKLEAIFDPSILMIAIGITIVAFIGKIMAGLVAGKKANKAIIGWGMVPRGEVGLIFASVGSSLGVISDSVFAIIIFMVIVTTMFTPPMLAYLINRDKKKLEVTEPPTPTTTILN